MKWPLFGIILELGGVVEMFGRLVTADRRYTRRPRSGSPAYTGSILLLCYPPDFSRVS